MIKVLGIDGHDHIKESAFRRHLLFNNPVDFLT